MREYKGRDKLALAVDLFAGFDFDKEKNLYYYTSLEELKAVLESKKLSLKKFNLLEDVNLRDNLITLVENLENKLEVKDLNLANKRQFFREIELHIKDIFAEDFDSSSYIEEFIARVALEINQRIANKIRKYFENNFNKLYFASEENVIDCINKFIKQLKEKNIELDEYDYSDLKKIAKKYFDIQLAEIVQQWCEVYLLSLTKEADYWPLWSKYPDGDGYNLEFEADKPKVEFGINKDNLLTPVIKLPLTASGDLKVLSSIGIGPNNAAGIARRSLEYFLKEKEIAAELKESDTI